MGKGYAEGPAAEERQAALDRDEGLTDEPPIERPALYGATPDNPEKHFIGWADELDQDALFEEGKAWGLSVRPTPFEGAD
jgi:hypothetical protein